jgi:hypothetical protein
MKTKRERNSFEGMRVIADYNVGDQRIIVLERSDSAQEAVARRQARMLAKTTPPIAERSTIALAASGSGPWRRQTTNIV